MLTVITQASLYSDSCGVLSQWEETGKPGGDPLSKHGENIHRKSTHTVTQAQNRTWDLGAVR